MDVASLLSDQPRHTIDGRILGDITLRKKSSFVPDMDRHPYGSWYTLGHMYNGVPHILDRTLWMSPKNTSVVSDPEKTPWFNGDRRTIKSPSPTKPVLSVQTPENDTTDLQSRTNGHPKTGHPDQSKAISHEVGYDIGHEKVYSAFRPARDLNNTGSGHIHTLCSFENKSVDRTPRATSPYAVRLSGKPASISDQSENTSRLPRIMGKSLMTSIMPPLNDDLVEMNMASGFPSYFPRRRRREQQQRRQRTTFTNDQTLKLEVEYQRTEYITRPRRYELAEVLALTETQIKIWFQNRRAKDKRIEKAQMDQQMRAIGMGASLTSMVTYGNSPPLYHPYLPYSIPLEREAPDYVDNRRPISSSD